MNFGEYQKLSSRTANMNYAAIMERLALSPELLSLDNFALGLTGEAGEVADQIKKVIYHGHILDVAEIKKELGDVLWYWSQLAKVVGLDAESVAVANIEKLMKRYPEGFSEQASKERVDVCKTCEGSKLVPMGPGFAALRVAQIANELPGMRRRVEREGARRLPV